MKPYLRVFLWTLLSIWAISGFVSTLIVLIGVTTTILYGYGLITVANYKPMKEYSELFTACATTTAGMILWAVLIFGSFGVVRITNVMLAKYMSLK
jgi:hypothetical protein